MVSLAGGRQLITAAIEYKWSQTNRKIKKVNGLRTLDKVVSLV